MKQHLKHHLFKIIIVLITSTALLVSLTMMGIHKPTQGVAVVPVADLVGTPLSTAQAYATMPICGGNDNPFLACQRVHQLLFNEQVTILEQRDNEYLIALPSVFYITADNAKEQRNTYWVLKDTIVTFDELQAQKISLKTIPCPIQFKAPHKKNCYKNTVTLLLPVYDPQLHITFSAGTRFVLAPEQTKLDSYLAFAYDKQSKSTQTITLPKHLCLEYKENLSKQDRIKQFLQILRTWATLPNGYIPYVWGGSSLTAACTAPGWSEMHYSVKDKSVSYFELHGHTQQPHTGFDCSSIIARAAQMAGIPYFYKNTYTIEQRMKQFKKGDTLAEGDLILIPRHVMIVASLANNTLIEARSYPHGYGKVQEIALGKVFKDITTYDQLVETALTKSTAYRIDSNGAVRETIPQVKLMKMVSAWDSV